MKREYTESKGFEVLDECGNAAHYCLSQKQALAYAREYGYYSVKGVKKRIVFITGFNKKDI